MYDSGTIDVQAHTVSHAMVFSSDRLLGFLQPRTRFSLLSRPVVEFGDRPRCLEPQDLGAPLYPVRSRMSDVWRYRDDDAVRTACIARVKKGGGETFFQKKNWQAELAEIVRGGSGRFETAEERENAVREELVKCREVLGARLRTNTIRQVCLPWGIGGTLAEKAARNAGYETAVADELYGKRFLHSGSNPFRIMRLKHQYIMRLPHNHG